MFRNNILLFLLLMGWNLLPAQSRSLDAISEDMGAFEKLYFYPSVLRALGGSQSETFIGLVKDIDLVIIINMDSAFVNLNQDKLVDLNKELLTEGYEEIASGFEKGVKNELFLLERKDKIEGFIFSRIENNQAMIIELIGNIQITKLNDLMSLDFENFTSFLK